MTRLEGSCHCGAIELTYATPQAASEIPMRVCQCTFCRRHNGRYTSHPEASLQVRGSDADINRYRFGTGTADFFLCSHCGVLLFAGMQDRDRWLAVLNLGCFIDFDATAENVGATDFDAEALDERLARRRRNWIGHVEFIQP